MLRPTIIPHTDDVYAWTRAPSTKSTSAAKMTGLRPRASARSPVSGEARRAKKEVHDVMRLLSSVVRGREERSEPIETRVEDMTPVLFTWVFVVREERLVYPWFSILCW